MITCNHETHSFAHLTVYFTVVGSGRSVILAIDFHGLTRIGLTADARQKCISVGPIPRNFDSVGLEEGPGMCIFNKCPRDFDAGSVRSMLWGTKQNNLVNQFIYPRERERAPTGRVAAGRG